MSLIEAQRNYASFGACERRLLPHIRTATPHDVRDPHWRRIHEENDNLEEQVSGIDYGMTYPADTTVLYYWRPKYWRR